MARFIAGPVKRKMATASGSTMPDALTGMSSVSAPRSIAGSEASEDWVLSATAWLGPVARMKRPKPTRPPIAPIGKASSQMTTPTAEMIST